MTYTINYDRFGKPYLTLDAMSIPFDEKNKDFRDFLAWNAKQANPLDWQTPIVMPTPPPSPPTINYRFDKLIALLATNKILTQEDLDKVNFYDLVP